MKFVSVKAGFARLNIGRTLGYEWITCGLLPKPVRVSGRSTGWLDSEVEAVITARAAGLSDQQIKAVVANLHKQRQDRAHALGVQ